MSFKNVWTSCIGLAVLVAVNAAAVAQQPSVVHVSSVSGHSPSTGLASSIPAPPIVAPSANVVAGPVCAGCSVANSANQFIGSPTPNYVCGVNGDCRLPGPTVVAPPPQSPVYSPCTQLGRLGIPPLTTRIRDDTPPIGRAVGRPLFGRWNGF